MNIIRDSKMLLISWLALGLLAPALTAFAADPADPIAVKVIIQGEVVLVDVEFDHRRHTQGGLGSPDRFRPSAPLHRQHPVEPDTLPEGNLLRVAQTGKTSFGPLSFEFQSERELTLNPYDGFESRMISGNMKRFRGSTQLEAIVGGTRLRYHSEAVPDTAMPLGLGRSLVESETREHYQDIRREVLKRKAAASAPQ